MSNYFNLVGRKLLGLEESIPGREVSGKALTRNYIIF
jgi:hypothetical protein